jgi:hypothetical protein
MKHPTKSNPQIDPSEIIFSVTMQDIISAISRRSLTVTLEELELAREEVKEAINYLLDIRDRDLLHQTNTGCCTSDLNPPLIL